MNVFRYIISRNYRDKFSEEYAKEFTGRFSLQDQEYDRIYEDMGLKESNEKQ